MDYFKSKNVDIPKTPILLDHGYHIDYLIEALEQVYPEIMTKIQFQLSTKPLKQEKAAQEKSGFVPAGARWVYAFGGSNPYERSNAWMERCKILVKNFERTRQTKQPKSISALSGSCLSGLQPLLEISNRFYTR